MPRGVSRLTLGPVILTLLAAPGVMGAQQTREEAAARLPSVDLPPALHRVLSDYEEAWEAGDGAALAGLFTGDGVIRSQGWIRGTEAIRARYDRIASGDLRLRAVDYGSDGATGYIVGAYGYGPGAAQQDAGVFVLALRKSQDGRWLIAADLDNGA